MGVGCEILSRFSERGTAFRSASRLSGEGEVTLTTKRLDARPALDSNEHDRFQDRNIRNYSRQRREKRLGR
jgi:hypothetical protein